MMEMKRVLKGYDVSITQGSKYAESDFTFNGMMK